MTRSRTPEARERADRRRDRMGCGGCGQICVRQTPGDDATWTHIDEATGRTWAACDEAPDDITAAWPSRQAVQS